MDADYGVANEHGLMFGECTDMSAHLPEVPYKKGGGIFYSAELSRVALERCKTAREAIRLMGSLIDEYGLWGTAETLAVADKEEAWVFEMQMSPTGKGGLWQRRPLDRGKNSGRGFLHRGEPAPDPRDPGRRSDPDLQPAPAGNA